MQKSPFYENEGPFLGYTCQETSSLDLQELDPTSMDNQFLPCHLQGDSSAFDHDNDPKHRMGSTGGHIHEFRELPLCQHPLVPSSDVNRISPYRSGLDPESRTPGAAKAPGANRTSRYPSECHLHKHIFPWMKETRQFAKQRPQSFAESGESASSCGEASPLGRGAGGGGGLGSGSKRARTTFTSSQLVELEKEFHFNRYLCRPRQLEMASLLKLSGRQIKIWFQNRRMKYKKDQKGKGMMEGMPDSSTGPSPTPSPSPSTAYTASIFHPPYESSRSAYGVAVYSAPDLPYSPHQQAGVISSLAQDYDRAESVPDYASVSGHGCAANRDAFLPTSVPAGSLSIADSPFTIVDYGCVVTGHGERALGPCDMHLPNFNDFITHCNS